LAARDLLTLTRLAEDTSKHCKKLLPQEKAQATGWPLPYAASCFAGGYYYCSVTS